MAVRPGDLGQWTDERRATSTAQRVAHMRVWRGDERGGDFEEFAVPYEEGEVVYTEPPPGTTGIDRDTPITLFVSSGSDSDDDEDGPDPPGKAKGRDKGDDDD